MADHGLLLQIAIYLLAVVVAVPLAKRLGLGSVLGYLAAGIAIGPWGLGLIANVKDILHLAEFGVVLLLFLIGLELNPKRLWAMRRAILAAGGGQVALTTAALLAIGLGLGLAFNQALIVAMALSLSSTAIALQSLTERNLLATPAGRTGFAVLLFQDIAVIPMLALLPLLGAAASGGGGEQSLLHGVKVVAVIAAIIVGGHYLTRPIFRYIAATRLREVFTAFALLLVTGIALLMAAVDLSMALGAFLAGVLLAESEYRHELEVEIEPFKGLLLGLFFIAVGMSVDFRLLLENPGRVLGLVPLLVAVKVALLALLARRAGVPEHQRLLFAFVLSQGGEFAFVLFSVAAQSGVLPQPLADALVVVVTLSMATTPLLLLLYERVIAPRFADAGSERAPDPIEGEGNPVIIAGFGRFGRVVGRLLHANRIPTTILDHDPDQIEEVRSYGYKVYYGDATNASLLGAAGAADARLLIVTLDDPEETLQVVKVARKHFPDLTIYARAHDMAHTFELMRLGVPVLQRELLESSFRLGEHALRHLGFGAYQARQAVNRFRDHDRELLQALYEADALDKRISITRQAREEVEKVLQADEEVLAKGDREGWE